jgi:hypothetical protein
MNAIVSGSALKTGGRDYWVSGLELKLCFLSVEEEEALLELLLR